MGNGGSDNSGALSSQDEARKSALRNKINSMYGIETPQTKYQLDNGTQVDQMPTATPALDSEGNPKSDSEGNLAMTTPNYTTVTLPDTVAQGAQTQMSADDVGVSDATRSYYGDQLSRSFAAGERGARFRLARQGLEGGSADIDTNTELQTDNNLGATRIDQAARAAATSLDQQREQERLNSINLVNAGAGTDAVASAQAGLHNTLAVAQNQSRASLFNDLFASGTDAYSTQNNPYGPYGPYATMYGQQLGSYFPTAGGGSAGRITAN